jgi:hypothetical protein
MSLVFCVGLILGFIFLLPVVQQGVGLVVVIFVLAVLIRVFVSFIGYV